MFECLPHPLECQEQAQMETEWQSMQRHHVKMNLASIYNQVDICRRTKPKPRERVSGGPCWLGGRSYKNTNNWQWNIWPLGATQGPQQQVNPSQWYTLPAQDPGLLHRVVSGWLFWNVQFSWQVHRFWGILWDYQGAGITVRYFYNGRIDEDWHFPQAAGNSCVFY